MMLERMITSTVLILVIFCLRKLTMGKISMRLRYALWLLVAARLLVPASVGTTAFSVMNLLPETVLERAQTFSSGRENGQGLSAEDETQPVYGGVQDSAYSDGKNGGAEPAAGEIKTRPEMMPAEERASGEKAQEKNDAAVRPVSFFPVDVLGVIWILGFLAVGGYMVTAQWRFVRFLYKNRKAFPAEALPEAFAQRFLRRGMKVYQVKGLPGACLAGGHIYVGEGTGVQEQNLTHVLAHEYCHARHGDGFWAFLRSALAAVYWFDPFVWAAAYAARQDSELACDEAAVSMLGESGRFAYGRTLLALLENGGKRERCPGMTIMMEGSRQNVRERITALAKKGRTKRPVFAAVMAAVILACGCAFTGAEREGANPVKETGAQDMAGTGENAQGDNDSGTDGRNRQMQDRENSGEFASVQKEYEDAAKNVKLSEEQIRALEESARQEADWQAFTETLHYHGAMEGKDDSELSKNREFDIQGYYDWLEGKGGEKPEDGWYLLCREDGGMISLYGLYTEAFGFRGLKTRIGTDVNTLDLPWCASYQNGNSENIRILEIADGGWPRRFVWKLPTGESAQVEKWQLYEGYRYDTGTIDLKILTPEACVKWAEKYLTFNVDQEAARVHVVYDEDMYLGDIDISSWQDRVIEDVRIVPDSVGFWLEDPENEANNGGGADAYQTDPDGVCEGTAHMTVGLKLKGLDGLWFHGLPVLTIQIVADENSDSGFRLVHPEISETFSAKALWQKEALNGD